MRCSNALAALFDREHCDLAPRLAAALARHLARCPACAAEAEPERGERAVAALSALRQDLPFEIDVRPRVRRAIAAPAWSSADEPTRRELAWSAVAALAACVAIVVGLGDSLPVLRAVAERAAVLKHALNPLGDVVGSVGATALGLAARGFAGLVSALPELRAVLALLGSVSAAAMAATIGFVILRDVRRAPRLQRG